MEIHGAHLYLISQFLSPITNQRTDRYGGDARARATLAIEVVRAMRQKLGKNYPILFRLNAVEKVKGGQTLEDALEVSRLLAHEGVDALDVSVIANSSWKEVDGQSFLVASSALSKEILAGKISEIIPCEECMTCYATIGRGKPMACKVNRDLPKPAR